MNARSAVLATLGMQRNFPMDHLWATLPDELRQLVISAYVREAAFYDLALGAPISPAFLTGGPLSVANASGALLRGGVGLGWTGFGVNDQWDPVPERASLWAELKALLSDCPKLRTFLVPPDDLGPG